MLQLQAKFNSLCAFNVDQSHIHTLSLFVDSPGSGCPEVKWELFRHASLSRQGQTKGMLQHWLAFQ